jgi:hypothetical protein
MIAKIKQQADKQYQLQQMRASKLERDLYAQQLASQRQNERQNERASQLEQDAKKISSDKEKLENLVKGKRKN